MENNALQVSASLCKHHQKEETYTKETISTYNWRAAKELAIPKGVQGISNPMICRTITFIYSCFTKFLHGTVGICNLKTNK